MALFHNLPAARFAMPTFPFYTSSESIFVERLDNFVAKAPNYTAVISVLTPARIALVQKFLDALQAVDSAIFQIRTYSQQLTAARSLLLSGPSGGPGVNWTAAPAVAPLVAAVPPDQIRMLNSLISQIKSDPGYTLAIGEDLGIVPPVAGAVNDDAAFPILKNPVSFPGGHAQFQWVKGSYSSLYVESRRGASQVWEPLNVDQQSPFDDIRPLLGPGEGEDRFYRAHLMRGDNQVGQFSPVLMVRVAS